MKLGLIARADKTGLGNQTYEFYRHMTPDKTLVVDMSHFDSVRFGNNETLYPGAGWMKTITFPQPVAAIDASEGVMREFLENIDVLFTCETPYHYRMFQLASELGVKTALQYNYEFLDYVTPVGHRLPQPDLFIAPSMWHYDDVPFTNKTFLPVPINREVLPYRKRTRARKFLHIAGNYMREDRNGTRIFLDAIKYVRSDVEFIIRSQYPLPPSQDPRVKIVSDVTENYWDLYDEGDVFVMPRRFGGLCLPLNEAMSTGMAIVMPDVSPQNLFLHPLSLLPTCGSYPLQTRAVIDVYDVDPKVLAERIDFLAGDPSAVQELSEKSNSIAAGWSWDSLRTEYDQVLRNL